MKRERKSQANILARECIAQALLQLIKEKPLSAITVSELTQRAGVSRMTFYRNYRSKEEIFSLHLRDIFIKYEEEDRQQQLKGIYYDRAHMLHCFKYWYEYREFFDGLIHCGFGNIFLDYLTQYVQQKWLDETASPKEYYKLSGFAGGFYNIYISGASGGYRESLDEIAGVLDSIYGT